MQPTLFDVPSGPATPIPPPSANSREAYWHWRRGPEGRRAWAQIESAALSIVSGRGERARISTKSLVEYARGSLHLHINNSYTAYIADELIERFPFLKGSIERRRRHK